MGREENYSGGFLMQSLFNDSVSVNGEEVGLLCYDRDTPLETWCGVMFYRGVREFLFFPRVPTRDKAIEDATRILANREAFGSYLIGEGTRRILEILERIPPAPTIPAEVVL